MFTIPEVEQDGELDQTKVVQLHIQSLMSIADELYFIRKELEDG